MVLVQVVMMVDQVGKVILANKEDRVIQDPEDLQDYEEIRVARVVLVLMAHQELLDGRDLLERKVLMTVCATVRLHYD